MATCQNETVNSVPQAPETDQADYHARRYLEYLAALRAWATLPAGVPDDHIEAISTTADEIADDLMTGPAATLHAVMLKARTAHHWTMARAQASVIDPRTLAEMFGIIAADLEILLASSGAGKAVRS